MDRKNLVEEIKTLVSEINDCLVFDTYADIDANEYKEEYLCFVSLSEVLEKTNLRATDVRDTTLKETLEIKVLGKMGESAKDLDEFLRQTFLPKFSKSENLLSLTKKDTELCDNKQRFCCDVILAFQTVTSTPLHIDPSLKFNLGAAQIDVKSYEFSDKKRIKTVATVSNGLKSYEVGEEPLKVEIIGETDIINTNKLWTEIKKALALGEIDISVSNMVFENVKLCEYKIKPIVLSEKTECSIIFQKI